MSIKEQKPKMISGREGRIQLGPHPGVESWAFVLAPVRQKIAKVIGWVGDWGTRKPKPKSLSLKPGPRVSLERIFCGLQNDAVPKK